MVYVFVNFRKQSRQKGRVSVPSSFRAYLNSMGYNGFITYPSFNNAALDACAQDRIEKLSESIDSFGPFEDKRDYFATSVLAESINLNFDSEGRVSIPKKLLIMQKIKSNIIFVGLGKVFQMWDPNYLKILNNALRKKSYIKQVSFKMGK